MKNTIENQTSTPTTELPSKEVLNDTHTSELVICDHCGSEFDPSELTEVHNGEKVCKDCLESDYFYCECCGEYKPNSEGITIYNGEKVCEDCICDNYFYCECCGEYKPNSEGIPVYNANNGEVLEYICEDCLDESEYITCDHCGNVHRRIDTNSDEYGNHICDHCLDEYVACDHCGRIVHVDNAIYHRDRAYCADCAEDYIEKTIKNYGHTTAINFYGEGKKAETLYMGFELESGGVDEETAESCASEIREDFDPSEQYFDLKEDSSIDKCGFELVSQPMNLEFHKNFKWERIFKAILNNGLRSHDCQNCGLHIHLDREFFGYGRARKANLIKLAYFVAKYRKEWETIARRKSDHYFEYLPTNKAIKEALNPDRRHIAVNFSNSGTVEFRLFKGTLKYSTVIATLELVDAVANWVKTKSARDFVKGYANFANFAKYVRANRQKYSNACNYLTSKDL